MDISGLLKALALLLTGAVIPLIPVIYVAVFGQQSLIDWYRKRAAGTQGERFKEIAARTVAHEEGRAVKKTANSRKRTGATAAAKAPVTHSGADLSLVARWGFAVFILVAYSLDIDEYNFGATNFLGISLVTTCIASPILLGIGLVLAMSGAQAAGFILAIGFAALLLFIFLFGGFLVMGLMLALALEAAEW